MYLRETWNWRRRSVSGPVAALSFTPQRLIAGSWNMSCMQGKERKEGIGVFKPDGHAWVGTQDIASLPTQFPLQKSGSMPLAFFDHILGGAGKYQLSAVFLPALRPEVNDPVGA